MWYASDDWSVCTNYEAYSVQSTVVVEANATVDLCESDAWYNSVHVIYMI
jgi:hypothetical protein